MEYVTGHSMDPQMEPRMELWIHYQMTLLVDLQMDLPMVF